MAKARAPNAVDFWRGIALVMIFVNHIPGNFFSYLTLRNFALSDAAELFVFLAGWSLSYATGGPQAPHAPTRVVVRLLWRAFELYRAQLMIAFLALAILAVTARLTANPLFLEWHNAGSAFYDAPRAVIGSVLLTYQLGYFNILPLYIIILLLFAPPLILLARRSRVGALAVSGLIYLAALLTRRNFPSWPSSEPWYFNPLSWQLLLVLGFVCAEAVRSESTGAMMVWARRLVWPSVALLVAGVIVVKLQLFPDPLRVPEPRMLFIFEKTFLTPARLISLAALVIAFHQVFGLIGDRLGPVSNWICGLGRNSLAVFCVASILSLLGQIIRFFAGDSFLVDLATLLSGLGVMGFTAWLVEWRRGSSGSQSQRG